MIKLIDLAKELNFDNPMLAIVNNKLRELSVEVERTDDIKFLDISNPDGYRAYSRTLKFIFIKACSELYPGQKVVIEHSLCGGLYCEVQQPYDLDKIVLKMKEIVNNDLAINKIILNKEEAIKLFNERDMKDKADLMEYKEKPRVKLYECEGFIEHFYGHMLPSTGYVQTFGLRKYKNGMILLGPDKNNIHKISEFKDQEKLANIYREFEDWSNVLGITNVVELNKVIESGKYGDMIRTVEVLQEKKLSHIADMIKEQNKKIVLIAAPSSSGKTSFAHRLCIHLKVNGINTVTISMDNYFVDREFTPIDEDGKPDYESIEAIRVDQFNKDLKDLLDGKEINIPMFDFKLGKQFITDETMKLGKDEVIIIEGIHGLNPVLTADIAEEDKFKIYLSVLTQINLDNHSRIPTTDLRLLRRMVRDNTHRGSSAENTIMTWSSVRRGEELNIFPYQEQADVMFNSAGLHELALLKTVAKPLLEEIQPNSPAYLEAVRLLRLLQYFIQLDDVSDVPNTSIVREFIGGSKIVH